jgi:hypothetical protein
MERGSVGGVRLGTDQALLGITVPLLELALRGPQMPPPFASTAENAILNTLS